MICIRKDLIEKEIKKTGENFHPFRLHNRLISRLKHHYICTAFCEKFYDSEPDFDEEEYKMYMDFAQRIRVTGLSFWYMIMRENSEKESFCDEKHTWEECKAAYDKVIQTYADYEQRRLEVCSWQEAYAQGLWDMSQTKVDRIAMQTMNKIKKSSHSNRGRLYIAETRDEIQIYWYGRDYAYRDYWFVFKRKES